MKALTIQLPLLFFILFIIPFFSFSQGGSIPDSIQKKMNGKTDVEKVSILLQHSTALITNDYSYTIKIAQVAKELATKSKNIKGAAEALKIIGLANYFQGNHDKALESYLQSLKIYDEIKDNEGIVHLENEIGTLYRKNGNADAAIKHFERALGISKSSKNLDGIANTCNNMGIAFETKNNYDLALSYYKEALKTYSMINSKIGCSYSLNNISGVFLFHKQFDSSLVYLEKSLKLRRESNDLGATAISLNDIGEMLVAKKDYAKAIGYFEQSLVISNKIGFKDLKKNIYQFLSVCYSNMQDFKKAFEFHKQFSLLKDTIFNEQKNKRITEMKTKYDVEKKEKENAILLKENKIKTLELEQKEQQRNIIIGSFIIILLLAGIFYNHYRLKNKNKILQEREARTVAIFQAQEQEKIRISKELHDGVGPLLSLIKLNISSIEINASNEKIISKTKELASESIKEVRNISHNLMPSLIAKSGLHSALVELIEQINPEILKVELDYNLFTVLKTDTEINLYRIVQESINNIVKHANATQSTIKLEEKDNSLLLVINDNGRGFDSTKIASISGNGLNNICSRVDFMKGKINITSNSKTGSSFIISIPLNQI